MRLISFKLPGNKQGLIFTDNVLDWNEMKEVHPVLKEENHCLAILEGVDLHSTQVPTDVILTDYNGYSNPVAEDLGG